jgi:uncharacterized protein (TIGR03067 family)
MRIQNIAALLLRFVGTYLLITGLFGGISTAVSAEAEERQKLRGTWSFVKSFDEASPKKESRGTVQIVFNGDAISFVSETTNRNAQGTYTVNTSTNPKTMDISLDNSGKKRITQAIYELDDDTLKLCHYLGPKASKERPKEFVADKQTVVGLLKREKK